MWLDSILVFFPALALRPKGAFSGGRLECLEVKDAGDLDRAAGFRGCGLVDFEGRLQLLHVAHVRDRDKALLRAILADGVWDDIC